MELVNLELLGFVFKLYMFYKYKNETTLKDKSGHLRHFEASDTPPFDFFSFLLPNVWGRRPLVQK